MAKFERAVEGDFKTIVDALHAAVMDGSASASFEEESDMSGDGYDCAVRVYERYSWFGGNRVSMVLAVAGVLALVGTIIDDKLVLPIIAIIITVGILLCILAVGGKKWDQGDNEVAGYKDYRTRKKEEEEGEEEQQLPFPLKCFTEAFTAKAMRTTTTARIMESAIPSPPVFPDLLHHRVDRGPGDVGHDDYGEEDEHR